MSVADSIYKGSAAYGRFTALLGAILATIIGIFLLIAGIKHNNSVSLYSKSSMANITNKTCEMSNGKQGNCTYTVTFVDEYNNTVTSTLQTLTQVEQNTQVQISYNPNNKSDIRLSSENVKSNGYIMIVFGLIIALGAWFWVWVTRKYEFAASASGFSSAFDLFRN